MLKYSNVSLEFSAKCLYILYAFFWVFPWRLNQMLGNYLEESIQHSEHGESLKSGLYVCSIIMLHI